MENHYTAHQQALVKNHIVFCVLSFNEHDQELINETVSKFDYDEVIDLCTINKEAYIGWSWDGIDFHENLYDSWTLGEDFKWHPPVPKPGDNYIWNRDTDSWQEMISGSDN